MKIKIEKEDVIKTSTMITDPFLGTETITETTHIKLYSTNSNTFSFSLTHEIEPLPLHQLEHVILLDEHLVSNETCTVHLTNLLSNIYLQSSTKSFIILYISTEAINWKTERRGSKIEINVKENFVSNERDGEIISLTELSSELSRMDSGSSDETTKEKTTTKRSHVSTLKIDTEEIKGCILEKVISIREIQMETHPNESKNSFSFSLNYEKKQKIHHGNNLDGHKISVTVNRPNPRSKNKVEYTFPDQFHISKEACDSQLLIVLLEITDLSSKTREYLVDYLSREATRWDRLNRGEGIILEINVKDNVDASFEVESCSGDEEDAACSSRISTARMTETECAICLKGLLGEVSRMELSCSHLFHKDCVMTWLKNHSSCPLCRNNVDGQVAFLC